MQRRPKTFQQPPALQPLLFALLCVLALIALLHFPDDGNEGPPEPGVVADPAIVELSLLPASNQPVQGVSGPAESLDDEGGSQATSSRPEATRAPDMRLLSTVRDKTRVIPKGAYFHLVELSMKVSPRELEEKLAIRNPSLAEIVRNPDAFRGKPVRLEGYVRRITPIDPGPNNLGVRVLYECAVFSDEYDLNPWFFVVLHIPEGMPTGDGLRERVTATGYFLKLWAYQAGDGLRYAPLFIGPRLVWHPAPRETGLRPLEVALFVLLLGLVITFAVVLWWSARPAPPRRSSPEAQVAPPADLGAPEEFLRELEETER